MSSESNQVRRGRRATPLLSTRLIPPGHRTQDAIRSWRWACARAIWNLVALMVMPALLVRCTSEPAPQTGARALHVAVAANFEPVAAQLARPFSSRTGVTIALSAGASGKLAAQIQSGAPFDVFLSADSERPLGLTAQGIGVAATRKTYAWGRLALLASHGQLPAPAAGQFPSSEQAKAAVEACFAQGGVVAIADPALAPYGRAAREVLTLLELWPQAQGHLVIGESIAQTHQFVASGNAAIGLVAWAQVRGTGEGGGAAPDGSAGPTQVSGGHDGARSTWLLPSTWHAPIEQQGMVIKDSVEARAFLDFLALPEGQAAIARAGYDVVP